MGSACMAISINFWELDFGGKGELKKRGEGEAGGGAARYRIYRRHNIVKNDRGQAISRGEEE